MKRLASYFNRPMEMTIREEHVASPGESEVLVKTKYSAISAGTEMHLYRGDIPSDIALDTQLPSLAGTMSYPTKYGYAAMGEVVSVGSETSTEWLGRHVFAFNPHESYFVANVNDIIPIPTDIRSEDAVFLANMETAVSLVMDGRPLIGESVIVFGQGVVGLLLSALVGKHPIGELMAVDPVGTRRALAVDLGATDARTPSELSADFGNRTAMGHQHFDLAFELSGNSAALDLAISVVGYGGRVVVGSWYPESGASLRLGHEFHRQHIRITSSQVSEIAPRWRGRWTKTRRRATAWEAIREIQPRRLITHFCPLADAPRVYRLLHEGAHDMVQVVLTYD